MDVIELDDVLDGLLDEDLGLARSVYRALALQFSERLRTSTDRREGETLL